MTAAAHPLHDDLYIDLIDRAGADIDHAFVLGQYKGRLDTDNVQQLVRRLCSDHRRAVHIVARAFGNRELAAEQLRIADRLSSCLVIVHILTEQLAHTRHIRTAAAQERCRLERADTCFLHKVVGIDHDAGIDAVRLHVPDADSLGKILENLGNHLARG